MVNTNFNHSQSRTYSLHRIVIRVLIVLMVVEWGVLLYRQAWLSLFLVTAILLTVFSPIIFRKRMQMELPAEFHIIAVIFVFSALYLGEIQDFYHRFWWWDVVLHTTAGLLMGILGFLLIYILNESKTIHFSLTPGFIAFFAFVFAQAFGSVWEIFEFSVDQLAGTNMQKPFLGDPSGLTDTMWDMIVNALGAIFISTMGYIYLKSGKSFFVRRWIQKFIDKNPKMFSS